MSIYNSLYNVNDNNIRCACLKDIQGLIELENECWPEPLRASYDEIKRRIEQYPDGQIVCEIDNNIVGAIYSQRIIGIDCLNGMDYATVSSLHTENGSIAQLLAVNVRPSMRQFGVGDQLLNFMLRYCLEEKAMKGVTAVTLCQDFDRNSSVLMEDYIRKRDERGQLVDKILRFHECHGAKIVRIVPGFRPNDVDNLGNGILVEYDKSSLDLPVSTTNKAVSERNDRDGLSSAIEGFVCSSMGTDPAIVYSTKTALLDMGLSSLDLFGLRMAICRQTGADIDPAFFFKYPNPDSIIEYFFSKNRSSQSGDDKQLRRESSPSTEDVSINKTQNNLSNAENSIAIIGMACRFPNGADTLDKYWHLLQNGEDAITGIPEQRNAIGLNLNINAESQGQEIVKYGGFLNDIDLFDARFFNITPREAANIDPQQRLLLELTWEALENAGINPESLAGSQTGVFTGVFSNDYELLQVKYNGDNGVNTFFATGTSPSLMAGRVSYVFGFNGPTISVNTACSSSLAAVHMARQSLLNKECGVAIASGTNLLLSPELNIAFAESGMLAPDGRCKTFDADANGYVRSEGCGVVVLKPLLNAIEDNDNIFAVVRGSALNHDGASNGLTAPNGIAQESVIRKALSDAGITPDDVSYIEAHGTGTELGDPVEFKAIENVFAPERVNDNPLFIGSVKTNIGHTEAAAGIAGLIKTSLALRNSYIPQHLHLKKLNPLIQNEKAAINIPVKGIAWPKNGTNKKHIAGVSSFGFSGTNAHIILEEAGKNIKKSDYQNRPDREPHIFTLSTKDGNALKELAQRYKDYIVDHNDEKIADICYTVNSGRAHFDHSLAIVAESVDELSENLNSFLAGNVGSRLIVPNVNRHKTGNIGFLFTGQGSQYVNMGRELYETQPLYREIIEECAETLNEFMEMSLLELLYPLSGKTSPLDQTQYTQPALFVLEYAIAKLWSSWGVQPQIVIGHSVGEYAAACVAGIFSLKDGLKLIANRGRLMGALPEHGEMWALFTDEKTATQSISPFTDKVTIAAVNGPKIIVVSGDNNCLQKVIEDLAAKGVSATKLSVSHAFHSPLMQPMLDEFKQIAEEISFSTPAIPIVSNISGAMAGAEIACADYWVKHVISPVQFASGMETLFSSGYEMLLEIGPKPVLTGMGRRLQNAKRSLWMHSLNEGVSDSDQMLLGLGSLYVNGVDIDWQNYYSHNQPNRVELPTYPFQRQRHWIGMQPSVNKFAGMGNKAVSESVSVLERSGNFTDEELKLAPKLLKALEAQTPTNHIMKAEEENIFNVEWKRVDRQINEVNQEMKNRMDGEKWLVFSDKAGLGVRLTSMLRGRGAFCITAFYGESYTQPASNEFTIDPAKVDDFRRLINDAELITGLNGIIHLCGREITEPENIEVETVDNDSALWCKVALHTVQTLDFSNVASTNIWLVTQGGQQRVETVSGISQSLLWGLGNVIMREHPKFNCKLVDMEPDDHEQGLNMLVDEIEYGRQHNTEPFLSFYNGQRFAARFKSVAWSSNVVNQFEINHEGTYLITGGLGGVGLMIATWLVNFGAKHMVLIGRSASTETSSGNIDRLKSKGCEVVVMQADVSNKDELNVAFNKIEKSMPSFIGIFHCAGIFDDKIIVNHEWSLFERVFAAKVKGAWNLHLLTQERKLDIFVLFSSIFSVLPESGLGNYAAANSFMDALARYRKVLGLPGLSVNWGPWGNVGMAKSVGEKRMEQWAMRGIDALTTEQALKCFEVIISRGVTNAVVASLNIQKLMQSFSNDFQQSFFSDLSPVDDKMFVDNFGVMERLEKAPKENRRDIVREYVNSLALSALGFDSNDSLDDEKGFFQLGMDSLTSLEMRNRLELGLKMSFPSTLLFKYPSIGSLTDYLVEELFDAGKATVSNNSPESVGRVNEIEIVNEFGILKDMGVNQDEIPDNLLVESVEDELEKLERLLD